MRKIIGKSSVNFYFFLLFFSRPFFSQTNQTIAPSTFEVSSLSSLYYVLQALYPKLVVEDIKVFP